MLNKRWASRRLCTYRLPRNKMWPGPRSRSAKPFLDIPSTSMHAYMIHCSDMHIYKRGLVEKHKWTHLEWLNIVTPFLIFLTGLEISFSSSLVSLSTPSIGRWTHPSLLIRLAKRSAISCLVGGLRKREWRRPWLTWGWRGIKSGRSRKVPVY